MLRDPISTKRPKMGKNKRVRSEVIPIIGSNYKVSKRYSRNKPHVRYQHVIQIICPPTIFHTFKSISILTRRCEVVILLQLLLYLLTKNTKKWVANLTQTMKKSHDSYSFSTIPDIKTANCHSSNQQNFAHHFQSNYL